MKNSLSRIALAVLGLLALAATAATEVPTLMNYQGRLTDAGGTPVANDLYEVTFRIYNESSVENWSEVHKFTTNAGLFSVVLGSNGSPLNFWEFDHAECWLGIQITGDPEMSPRQRLVSVPYAMLVSTLDGADGGTVNGDLVVKNNIHLGTGPLDGRVYVYQGGTATPVLKATSANGQGGNLQIINENNAIIAELGPDMDNEGAYLYLEGGTTNEYFVVDGNYNGGGDPVVSIVGSVSSTVIMTNTSGDASVQLPANAIHSYEMINEPGIASEHTTAQTTLNSSAMSTLQTVTITIPADGYIQVQGKCYMKTYGTSESNYCSFQIDQTAGGGNVFPYVTRAGNRAEPTGGDNYYPIFTSRVYQESAGTHTYIFEGRKDQLAGSAIVYHTIVTAMYFPTSYGPVMAMSADASDLPGSTPVRVQIGEEPEDYGTMYEIDLRVLEQKAARLRAEALKAERDLMAARRQATGGTAEENR